MPLLNAAARKGREIAKMNIHIDTQCHENYGTPEAPYWKAKGGRTIVVTGFNHPLNDRIGAAAQAVVDAVAATLITSNDMYEEYMIDWSFAAEDALTHDEQLQVEYEGRIVYPATRVSLQVAA
jgi:hypothetical protein